MEEEPVFFDEKRKNAKKESVRKTEASGEKI